MTPALRADWQAGSFRKAQNEAPCAGGRLRYAVFACFQLHGDIGIADDRPGDELRKHGDIRCQIDQVPLRRDRPAVHVHGVAQDLERIEADADRERKAQQRRGQPGQRVQVCDHEIGILEIRKRPEAQENRQDQKQLRPSGIAEALDQPSENIALQDGDEHDRQIARLTPAIKHKARQEQHAVFRPFGYEKVDKQDSRRK
ncbi:MAG: hypothetical protein ACLS3C_00365 [Oscillospiraceae bacterium]